MSSPKNIWPIASVTVAGHFVAAFAALCIPPFYGRLLQESFSGQQLALTGWFFTLPTLAAALANPCWGRLADRIGKRAALLRAHLGLALSFWLTSQARTPYEFALGLVAQGALGGTFAAANAFLATLLPPRLLAQLLSVMQASARCALFLGPLAIGLAAGYLPLLDAFAYLAWLPLAAALFLFILPPPAMAPTAGPAAASNAVAPAAGGTTAGQLYGLQCCFAAGTVLSFPYLVLDLGERFAASPGTAGLIFGLPHAIFLLAYLLFEHGLVFEPHMQNLIAVFAADGRPAQIFLRDLELTRRVAGGRHATAITGTCRALPISAGRGLPTVCWSTTCVRPSAPSAGATRNASSGYGASCATCCSPIWSATPRPRRRGASAPCLPASRCRSRATC